VNYSLQVVGFAEHGSVSLHVDYRKSVGRAKPQLMFEVVDAGPGIRVHVVPESLARGI